jgi:Lamin Tail Domain
MRARAFLLSAIVTAGLALGLDAQGSLADLVKADVNGDLIVDNADLAIVRAAVGKRQGQVGYDPRADMDGNGIIGIPDLSFVQRYLGRRLPVTTVHINEIESSGGVPGDWIELTNTGASAADVSGWLIRDNDDTHNFFLPAGSTIAAGGYLLVEEAALGFGLGAADAVRLYDPNGALFESYSWTAHASTTYGRCPNGTGAFTTTTSVTKGTANDCATPAPAVHINEIESNGGVPGDWIEIINTGANVADLSGWRILDNDDTHVPYTLPAGTTIAAGGYLVVEEAAFGFGLGSADSVRLFNPTGALVDSYAWTAHASTTYGRCPNGTGAFTTTSRSTKGGVNACPGDALQWPGGPDVQTADGLNVLGGNMSGLVYEGSGNINATPGVLWAVRNGPGTLFRLVWNGTIWTPDPDPTNTWGAGKALRYTDGTGNPDAEGVTFAGSGSAAGIYVSTERNNDASGVSRNSILRFDPTATGASLTATHEWNLTADLPVTGQNLGMEAITWIPDTFLVSRAFVDETRGPTYAYNPADYPNHGTGLFFVGLEANGMIYAYALDHVGGGFTRVATIASGLLGVMDLQLDRELNDLWAVCDDGCQGRSVVLRIDAGTGTFKVTHLFDRPAGMPNLNNEGFAFAPLAECVGDRRPAFWSDDTGTDGHAIRRGTLGCTPF